MSSSLKKAGETAVKRVAKTALKEPRAVSAAEAPSIEGAKESSKQSMMPWKGWLSRMFAERFGEERLKAVRELILYRPDDIHDMNQIPKPATKVPLTEDGKVTHQFRYPSPGSQDPVSIPKMEGDPYDVSYYKRDTARRDELGMPTEEDRFRLELMDPNDPAVKELKEELKAGPGSSPGNKGRFATGPTDFDPTGLRATMSANHAALQESLDAHMPDHLPRPEWWNKQDELVAWYEERDLPVPAGGTGWGLVPKEERVAKW